MAKKKLDLSGMYRETDKTQKEHNIDITQAQEKEAKIYEKYAAYRQAEGQNDILQIEKAKRINMAFSDDVYAQIHSESERLGVGAAYYVNAIIRQANLEKVHEYYEAQPIKVSKNCVPRRKGKPARRITIKIEPDVYGIISAGAERYNQTLTQYANLVLESSMR